LHRSASQRHVFLRQQGTYRISRARFSALRAENRAQLKMKHRSAEGAIRQLRKYYSNIPMEGFGGGEAAPEPLRQGL